MIKALIFDKDGSLAKFPSRYMDEAANYFADNALFPSEKQMFLNRYEYIRDRMKIGTRINTQTLEEEKEGELLRGTPWAVVLAAKPYNVPEEKQKKAFSEIPKHYYGVNHQNISSMLKNHHDNGLFSGIVTNDDNYTPIIKPETDGYFVTNAKKETDIIKHLTHIHFKTGILPEEIAWVEDDLIATRLLANYGVNVLYQKNPDFTYVDDKKIKEYGALRVLEADTNTYDIYKTLDDLTT